MLLDAISRLSYITMPDLQIGPLWSQLQTSLAAKHQATLRRGFALARMKRWAAFPGAETVAGEMSMKHMKLE